MLLNASICTKDELVSDRPSWTTSEASPVTTTSSRSVSETHTPDISPFYVHTVLGGQAVFLQSQYRTSMAASIDQHVSSRRSPVSAASSRHFRRTKRHEPNSVTRTSTDGPIIRSSSTGRVLQSHSCAATQYYGCATKSYL